jgi:hypothetical protein
MSMIFRTSPSPKSYAVGSVGAANTANVKGMKNEDRPSYGSGKQQKT